MARAKGKGTFYKRTDGLWCGQVVIGYDPLTGKRVRKSVYAKTRREAKEKIQELLKDANSFVSESINITLIDWMCKWLNTYMRHKIRPRTFESYEGLVRIHVKDIGHVKLKDLRPITIQKFINGKSHLSKATIKHIRRLLKAALEQAVINEIISKNPAAHIEMPSSVKPKVEERAFTPEERVIVNEAIKGTHFECAFIIAMETGLRRGEILGLTWDEVDFENEFIYVNRGLVDTKVNGKAVILEQPPKSTAGNRGVPMSSRVMQALKSHRQYQRLKRIRSKLNYLDNNLVFATATGTYVSPNNLSKSFKRIVTKAGLINCRFKTLRHTFATRLAENDVHLKTAQALLGHADVTTTANIYTHVLNAPKIEAIKRLEMEKNF